MYSSRRVAWISCQDADPPSIDMRGLKRLRPTEERLARVPLGWLDRLAEVAKAEQSGESRDADKDEKQGRQSRRKGQFEFNDEEPIRVRVLDVDAISLEELHRAFMYTLVETSLRPGFFDFMRYEGQGGVRPLPLVISKPWSLQAYTRLMSKSYLKSRLYEQLKLHGHEPGWVLVQPHWGLCNRLRAVTAGRMLANHLGREFVLDWQPLPDCNCRWRELFATELIEVDDLHEESPGGLSFEHFLAAHRRPEWRYIAYDPRKQLLRSHPSAFLDTLWREIAEVDAFFQRLNYGMEAEILQKHAKHSSCKRDSPNAEEFCGKLCESVLFMSKAATLESDDQASEVAKILRDVALDCRVSDKEEGHEANAFAIGETDLRHVNARQVMSRQLKHRLGLASSSMFDFVGYFVSLCP
eukprot:g2314.t1